MASQKEQVAKALAAITDVHEALVQFKDVGLGLKKAFALPYLPATMSKAISGLDACNAIRAILLNMDGGD